MQYGDDTVRLSTIRNFLLTMYVGSFDSLRTFNDQSFLLFGEYDTRKQIKLNNEVVNEAKEVK